MLKFKGKEKIMKKLNFTLLLVISAYGLFAQGNDNESSKTANANELKQKNQFQLFKNMLENRDFVLEADHLQDKYGHFIFVNSDINFVAVDSTTAIIQIGSDYRLGANGVGGVTAKGSITDWKLTEDKKQESFNLYINVMTSIGIYDLYFMIDSSGYGTATLTGLTPGQLTFGGKVVAYSKSSVFEGQSL
jgi:hypothetical protein